MAAVRVILLFAALEAVATLSIHHPSYRDWGMDDSDDMLAQEAHDDGRIVDAPIVVLVPDAAHGIVHFLSHVTPTGPPLDKLQTAACRHKYSIKPPDSQSLQRLKVSTHRRPYMGVPALLSDTKIPFRPPILTGQRPIDNTFFWRRPEIVGDTLPNFQLSSLIQALNRVQAHENVHGSTPKVVNQLPGHVLPTEDSSTQTEPSESSAPQTEFNNVPNEEVVDVGEVSQSSPSPFDPPIEENSNDDSQINFLKLFGVSPCGDPIHNTSQNKGYSYEENAELGGLALPSLSPASGELVDVGKQLTSYSSEDRPFVQVPNDCARKCNQSGSNESDLSKVIGIEADHQLVKSSETHRANGQVVEVTSEANNRGRDPVTERASQGTYSDQETVMSEKDNRGEHDTEGYSGLYTVNPVEEHNSNENLNSINMSDNCGGTCNDPSDVGDDSEKHKGGTIAMGHELMGVHHNNGEHFGVENPTEESLNVITSHSDDTNEHPEVRDLLDGCRDDCHTLHDIHVGGHPNEVKIIGIGRKSERMENHMEPYNDMNPSPEETAGRDGMQADREGIVRTIQCTDNCDSSMESDEISEMDDNNEEDRKSGKNVEGEKGVGKTNEEKPTFGHGSKSQGVHDKHGDSRNFNNIDHLGMVGDEENVYDNEDINSSRKTNSPAIGTIKYDKGQQVDVVPKNNNVQGIVDTSQQGTIGVTENCYDNCQQVSNNGVDKGVDEENVTKSEGSVSVPSVNKDTINVEEKDIVTYSSGGVDKSDSRTPRSRSLTKQPDEGGATPDDVKTVNGVITGVETQNSSVKHANVDTQLNNDSEGSPIEPHLTPENENNSGVPKSMPKTHEHKSTNGEEYAARQLSNTINSVNPKNTEGNPTTEFAKKSTSDLRAVAEKLSGENITSVDGFRDYPYSENTQPAPGLVSDNVKSIPDTSVKHTIPHDTQIQGNSKSVSNLNNNKTDEGYRVEAENLSSYNDFQRDGRNLDALSYENQNRKLSIPGIFPPSLVFVNGQYIPTIDVHRGWNSEPFTGYEKMPVYLDFSHGQYIPITGSRSLSVNEGQHSEESENKNRSDTEDRSDPRGTETEPAHGDEEFANGQYIKTDSSIVPNHEGQHEHSHSNNKTGTHHTDQPQKGTAQKSNESGFLDGSEEGERDVSTVHVFVNGQFVPMNPQIGTRGKDSNQENEPTVSPKPMTFISGQYVPASLIQLKVGARSNHDDMLHGQNLDYRAGFNSPEALRTSKFQSDTAFAKRPPAFEFINGQYIEGSQEEGTEFGRVLDREALPPQMYDLFGKPLPEGTHFQEIPSHQETGLGNAPGIADMVFVSGQYVRRGNHPGGKMPNGFIQDRAHLGPNNNINIDSEYINGPGRSDNSWKSTKQNLAQVPDSYTDPSQTDSGWRRVCVPFLGSSEDARLLGQGNFYFEIDGKKTPLVLDKNCGDGNGVLCLRIPDRHPTDSTKYPHPTERQNPDHNNCSDLDGRRMDVAVNMVKALHDLFIPPKSQSR